MAFVAAATGAAIAAPIIGGYIGQQQAGADRDAANAARRQALAQYANINIPDSEKMRLALEEYQSTGQMTPEMQQAIELGQSEMQNVSTDPRLRASQMQALEQMAGMASGQMTTADTAGFELSRQNAAGEMQAKNNQILQEMQQRGQAGSGAELLAKLKSNQTGADMLQKSQLEQAQVMQNARMQALMQQGNMSGELRGQDYTEASNMAKAKDAISRFNAENQQNVSNTNVGARNLAQATNISNRQQLNNANVDLRNKQQASNRGLQQTEFDNKMTLAAGKAGQYNASAAAGDRQAADTASMWATGGQGVGTALAAFAKKA